jgi:ribonuclease P protein component
MERLKRRAEFKAVAGGKRVSRSGFVLQALRAADAPVDRPARVGFTVTRKIGNAVVRNRIRRRLREAVRAAASHAEPATDYVLVGRSPALTLQFRQLVTDLEGGFAALARDRKRSNESGR